MAYVLAHEYAHNLQQELGIFDNRVTRSAKPFELQADCFAGTWANSVYEQGQLQPGDLEEASNAALAVGDFDVGNAQHQHPRRALLAGFDSGDRPARAWRPASGAALPERALLGEREQAPALRLRSPHVDVDVDRARDRGERRQRLAPADVVGERLAGHDVDDAEAAGGARLRLSGRAARVACAG